MVLVNPAVKIERYHTMVFEPLFPQMQPFVDILGLIAIVHRMTGAEIESHHWNGEQCLS